MQKNNEQLTLGGNPFLDVPSVLNATEYKKGYVMRKCCYENAKRSEFKTNVLVVSSNIFYSIVVFGLGRSELKTV